MKAQNILLVVLVLAGLAVAGWYVKVSNGPAGSGDKAPSSAARTADATADTTLAAELAKFAPVKMDVDTAFLSEKDRAVVNKLIRAADLMSEIYLRQISEDNPRLRAEIAASDRPDRDLLLKMFDLHFGVWNSLEGFRPFYGDRPLPLGAAFYPDDMTREEFETWIAAHPEDREAFLSPYTVIRRDGDRLIAIPYSRYYREWLEPAAKLLEEAAGLTDNESLKRYLRLRAKAFRTNDYFESDMAWMDLKGPIEVVIGPYEVYTDRLFGYKAAFEAFVTLKNPDESARVARYKSFLRDMEANLPVDDAYKNFRRGFASPIAVADQVHGGGDNVPGVQTIAFNLPNDERVREAKGAKKVLLKNVMNAKFDRILKPMAARVLVPEQAAMLKRDYMGLETLFHELSHSLGPGTIVKDGRTTTVNVELKDLYSAIEEGKADVMGAWNILYLMARGELPIAEKQSFLATYFTGLFRAMRFGTHEAHGRGAAYQYGYFKAKEAFTVDPESGLYRLDFARLENAIRDLVHDIVVLQGDGDYEGAGRFLDTYAHTDASFEAARQRMESIPVDIRPIYPDRI
ncbi:MAG: hypothetical protein D6757_01460 [Alphaproteobacteria bacterium]|nr:MAG: hypothetical protein D6757_01460 [Alphaproteobacteria bacterium]